MTPPSGAGSKNGARVPPGPPGVPLFGALPAFSRSPVRFLVDATRTYGDVLSLGKVFGKGVYVFSRPEHVKHILLDNNRNYVKGDGIKPLKLIVGEGIVVAEGERWHRKRRLLQPTYHRQRVATLVATMAETIAKCHERWQTRPADEPFFVAPEMMRLTQHVLMTTLLGVDIEAQADELCRAWDVVVDFVTERLLGPPINLPVFVPTPKNIRFRRAMGMLDRAVRGVVRERRASGPVPGDVISVLLAAKDEATGQMMDAEELRDEVMTVFAGGFETSASVLSWVWHCVAAHPEVEAKLHAEAVEVLGDRTLTVEDLPKLRYAKMVLEETLRLYPGVWIFSRSSVGDDEIGGYSLPAGSLIFLCPYLTHRRPELWPSPEVFDPERFAPEASADRPRYAFLPFGGGPRLCIGEAFALTEMHIIIAMTARRYRLRASPDGIPEPQGMLALRAPPNVPMRLEVRG